MSGRPGIIASAYVDADGGESPNQFKPFVSAEIRCHWPPLATDHEIGKALDDAMHDALRQISAKRGTRDTRTAALAPELAHELVRLTEEREAERARLADLADDLRSDAKVLRRAGGRDNELFARGADDAAARIRAVIERGEQ